jgi:hypothetical protein
MLQLPNYCCSSNRRPSFFAFFPAAAAVMRVERLGVGVFRGVFRPYRHPQLPSFDQEASWRSHNPPSFIVSNVNAGSVGESRTKDTPL